MKKFLLSLLALSLTANIFASEGRGLDDGKPLKQREQEYLENYSSHALDDACQAAFENDVFKNNNNQILSNTFLRLTNDFDETIKHEGKSNSEEMAELMALGDKHSKRGDAQEFLICIRFAWRELE